ncbi:MAG: hypothetical protein ACK4VW_10220, partial [Anaerolineales bacterium]
GKSALKGEVFVNASINSVQVRGQQLALSWQVELVETLSKGSWTVSAFLKGRQLRSLTILENESTVLSVAKIDRSVEKN